VSRAVKTSTGVPNPCSRRVFKTCRPSRPGSSKSRRAGRAADRKCGVERRHFAWVERDLRSGGIRFQVRSALGARNRNDIVALGEEPGQRELGRRAALRSRHLIQRRDQRKVPAKVVALEAGKRAAHIVLVEPIEAGDAAREEAASKRTEGHETDAEFAAGLKSAEFRIARPQRVFTLQRGNRMDAAGSPQ
jgi:hypothetical protein